MYSQIQILYTNIRKSGQNVKNSMKNNIKNKVFKVTDMTEGSIVKHIIMFSLPLMFGNIFQMLYNTVDSIVVGNFVGKEALAAIGSTTMIINMRCYFKTFWSKRD